MECLRGRYTEVWCATQNVSLARFADRARSILSTGLDWLGLPDADPPPRLISDLRSFDEIISWYGFGNQDFQRHVSELNLPLRFLSALPPSEGDKLQHAADFFLDQARKIGPCDRSAVPRLPIQRDPEGSSDFLVIHPFASSPTKRWDLNKFKKVASRMPVHVRWCAGPEETLDGAVRFDDLYQLAIWLSRARVYLGNDSGISHLAAAVGVPVVALFGPTRPEIWAPRGEHVRVMRDMEKLTVEEVCEAVLHMAQFKAR